MPGFPILSDENVDGPIVAGLRQRGWDLATVYEIFGQRSVDDTIFAYAAECGRVLVSTDTDCLRIARRWAQELRPFRMVYWPNSRTSVCTSRTSLRPSMNWPGTPPPSRHGSNT